MTGCRLLIDGVAYLVLMRLVSFRDPVSPADGGTRTGVLAGDEIVDLTDPAVGLPGDMKDLLAGGPGSMEIAAGAAATKARRFPLGGATLLAPVPHPPKVMGIRTSSTPAPCKYSASPANGSRGISRSSTKATTVLHPDLRTAVAKVRRLRLPSR